MNRSQEVEIKAADQRPLPFIVNFASSVQTDEEDPLVDSWIVCQLLSRLAT